MKQFENRENNKPTDNIEMYVLWNGKKQSESKTERLILTNLK